MTCRQVADTVTGVIPDEARIVEQTTTGWLVACGCESNCRQRQRYPDRVDAEREMLRIRDLYRPAVLIREDRIVTETEVDVVEAG